MREASPRILLVDDDPAILEALSFILESNGFACRKAENGFQALKSLRSALPDLVISDLQMPRMSGYELLPIIRRRYPQIGIIVMSAEGEESIQSLNLPLDGYLPKGGDAPFRLVNMIRHILANPRTDPQIPGNTNTKNSI